MPYLHLETTADVPENAEIPDILEALCREASNYPSVIPSRVRAYHTLRSVWVMGEGAKPAFVHLTAFVKSGRDLAWKKGLGRNLMEVLKANFRMSLEAEESDLTVDIREMESETYHRFPL